jgi:hypothetical protein
MARIVACLLVLGGIITAGPAMAQFGSIFGGDGGPPRPPADVPNGGFPAQPPPPGYPSGQAPQYPTQSPQAYPGQGQPYPQQEPYPQSQPYPQQAQPYPAYPNQGAPSYPSQPSYPAVARPVEAEPLPPPPGVAVAPPAAPGQAYPQRPPVPAPPAQRGAGTPPPANSPPSAPAAAAPPEDDTVVEAPTPHIDNGRAVFAGLDKITGRTTTFDAAIGETVQFGALQVTPRACYTRPATEATNTDAFVEVDEVTLQGAIKRIFTGWMFASSPGLHAVEHPIYDVWLTDCSAPVQTSEAEPPAAPATAPASAPVRRAPVRQQRPAARQAPPPVERDPAD